MLSADQQRLDLGPVISLFEIDLTEQGGPIEHFTPTTDELGDFAGMVSFGGVIYTPIDIQVEGYEVTGRGQLPTPTVRFANTRRTLTGAVNTYSDLVGAKVSRMRTLYKYLDGQPEEDPTAYWPPDIYRVAQKSAQNRLFIEFKLEAWSDLEGQNLPGRLVHRNWCQRVYRLRDTELGEFIYARGNFIADCPYAGSVYFTATGERTGDANLDVCGKKYRDCKNRFGNDPLPAYLFPGAGRIR